MTTPERHDTLDNLYLWDASGTPDAEVIRFERILSRYAQPLPPRPLPALTSHRAGAFFWQHPFLISSAAVAMAALLLVLVGPSILRHIAEPRDTCTTLCLAGAPRINGRVVTTSDAIRAGGLVETDSSSEAEIRFGLIGRVTVHSGSRLRLAESRPGRYRMALERGRISARTLAPPFTFVVDTPGPTAYDVGCAFTLETSEQGSGLLSVTSGWVQLELDDREVLIPAGAESQLRPGGALGTPHFADASEPFRSALTRLDFESMDRETRAAVLTDLLANARPRDVLSFLEMLRTAAGEERRRIVDRGIQLLPPASGITRAGLLRGDDSMLSAWRNQLGLPQVKRWWLHWRDILP